MRHMALLNTQHRMLFVMTIGWLATAFADIGDPPRAGGSFDAASTLVAQSARTDPLSHTGLPSILHDVNASTSPVIPDVTVTTPSPPTEQDLAEDSLYQFIRAPRDGALCEYSYDAHLARWGHAERLTANRRA